MIHIMQFILLPENFGDGIWFEKQILFFINITTCR